MSKDEILKSIESLDSEKDCREIQQAANKRGEAIRAEQWRERIAEYWKRAVFFREGETLYCAASGTFIGGPMQRGDSGKIYRMDIDGRKKTIWLKIGKRIIGFRDAEPLRYQLQREKPEKPLSDSEREMAKMLSRRFFHKTIGNIMMTTTNDILRDALYAGAKATDEIAPGQGKHMRKFADELYPESKPVPAMARADPFRRGRARRAVRLQSRISCSHNQGR